MIFFLSFSVYLPSVLCFIRYCCGKALLRTKDGLTIIKPRRNRTKTAEQKRFGRWIELGRGWEISASYCQFSRTMGAKKANESHEWMLLRWKWISPERSFASALDRITIYYLEAMMRSVADHLFGLHEICTCFIASGVAWYAQNGRTEKETEIHARIHTHRKRERKKIC